MIIADPNNPNFIHPIGPSKDTYYLLECEQERQREEREQWVRSVEVTGGSKREIEETDSSKDISALSLQQTLAFLSRAY